jgi:hypothetical protein
MLHLEKYAPLSPSLRGAVNTDLDEARKKEDANAEALIHTGVIPVEMAIRQYVQKYAKTAKIKNVVDTFIHKLEDAGSFEAAKKELAGNKEQRDKIASELGRVQAKIDSANDAKKFKDDIDGAVVAVSEESEKIVQDIIKKFVTRVTQKIDSYAGRKFSINEAKDEDGQMVKFAQGLQPDFQYELDKMIGENLVKTGDALLRRYREKIQSLSDELSTDLSSFKEILDPLKLVRGSISGINLDSLVREEEVAVGKKWVENTSKAWYKPWTWFQESGHYKTVYKTVEFVKGEELADKILGPIEKSLRTDGAEAKKHANKQSLAISKRFKAEFDKIDELLKNKLSELKSYATDKDKAEERIRESNAKIEWLDTIRAKVESILEI